MVITTTGVAFTLSALGLAFCGFWFFKAFQKVGGLRSGSKIGILLSTYFLGTAFQHSLLAIGGLFFAENPEAHFAVLVIVAFSLAFLAALGVYLAFYILLPNLSPWLATMTAFLYGVLVTGLTIIAHPKPFLNANRGIDWNMPFWLESHYFYLLLFQIGTLFLIFAKNFFFAPTRNVKTISFVIMLATFVGLINVSVRFAGFVDVSQNVRIHVFDRILGVIGILFVIGFLIIPIIRGWISKRSHAGLALGNSLSPKNEPS